jgi:hypothetical protein
MQVFLRNAFDGCYGRVICQDVPGLSLNHPILPCILENRWVFKKPFSAGACFGFRGGCSSLFSPRRAGRAAGRSRAA